VLQRLPRSSAVQTAVRALLDAEHELCCCALSLDEFAFTARSAAQNSEASRRLRTSFLYLPLSPAIDQLILESPVAPLKHPTYRENRSVLETKHDVLLGGFCFCR
jgi:hypothetical protein